MPDVPMREVQINGRWPLMLPEHRAAREEWTTGWEPERLDSMYANLRPGDVVYDIGTEEGDLSALFARWVRGVGARSQCERCRQVREPEPSKNGPYDACGWCDSQEFVTLPPTGPGGVVLVEPNPRVWPNIRVIWEANRLPNPLAAYACFVGAEDRARAGNDHLWGAFDDWPRCAHGEVIGDHGFLNLLEHPDHQVVTVDTIASTVAPPTAITMDVEGAEILVARGMQETLATHRPLVWVSVHAEAMFHDHGVYQAEFHSEFHRHGYEKVLLGFDHELHVFYFPSERRDEVTLP